MPISETVPLTVVQSVNRALDYIEVNLAGQLSLSLIAGAACVSPFHFQRMFRAVMGETPHAFVLRRRLENALGDISQGNRQPLTDIALGRGFSSLSDFSRNFRRHFGCSPRKLDLETCLAGRRRALDDTLAGVSGLGVTLQTMHRNFRSRCAISRSARSSTFACTAPLRKAPSKQQPCAWWHGHETPASSIISGWATSGINLVWHLQGIAGTTSRWRSRMGVIAVRSAFSDFHP